MWRMLFVLDGLPLSRQKQPTLPMHICPLSVDCMRSHSVLMPFTGPFTFPSMKILLCRGTKDLSNINLGSYYLSFSCANSSYSSAGSGTNYSTSYSLNTIPLLSIGASIQCQATYTIQQHDIEARQPVQLGAWGVCIDLPWGQQIVQAKPVYVDVMWDPRVTVDIVAGNCTHSRERTKGWHIMRGAGQYLLCMLPGMLGLRGLVRTASAHQTASA